MENLFQFRGDPARCQALLSETEITAEAPGTILRDAEVLLGAIGVEGVASASKNGNLPTNQLEALNKAMADPVELGLKRPLLRNYPNLSGVFLLLRAMEVVMVQGRRTYVDASALEQWRALVPVERYFALLETWLGRADPTVVDRRAEPMPIGGNLLENLLFLGELPASKRKIFSDYVHTYPFRGNVSDWSAQLNQRFGFAELQPASPTTSNIATSGRQGWRMARARRTPWGTAVTWALREFLAGREEPLWAVDEPPVKYGSLKTAFAGYFPDLKKHWALSPTESRPGSYVFAVTSEDGAVGKDFRRVFRVSGKKTLGTLVESLLSEIDFDFEHAYRLRRRDEQGRTEDYFGGFWMEEEPLADEVLIEDARLCEKHPMDLLYDFGAGWRFKIKLLRVESEDSALDAELLESCGIAPEQYPGGDF